MSLATHLDANTVFRAVHLVELTAVDGRYWYWTNASADVTTGGKTYKADGPIVGAIPSSRPAGLQVATLDLALGAGSLVLANDGRKIVKAAADGVFNGARVRVLKLIWGPSGIGDDSLGAHLRFAGVVTGVRPSSWQVILSVKSDAARLAQPFPIHTYQPACGLALYSVACGVNKASFTTATEAGAGSTGSILYTSAAVAGHQLGVVTFASVAGGGGANAGLRRMVASVLTSPARLVLNVPLPVAPQEHDVFSVTKGCDKTLAMCTTTFSNGANHLGFASVPADE